MTILVFVRKLKSVLFDIMFIPNKCVYKLKTTVACSLKTRGVDITAALHALIKGEPGLPGLPFVGAATGRRELSHTPAAVESKPINDNFPAGFIVGPPGPKGAPVRYVVV